MRGRNRFSSWYLSPTVSSVYFHTVEIYIKRKRKILASWFREEPWPLRSLILAKLLLLTLPGKQQQTI